MAMLRYLRFAVTAMGLTALMLSLTLWVRSYWGREFLGEYLTPKYKYEMFSLNGKLLILKQQRIFIGVELRVAYPDALVSDWASRSKLGIAYASDELFALLAVSYWLLTSLTIGLAAAPWLTWRFSLRTLLIATALIALGLGIVAASS
jgi:hypothetical protein